MSRKEQVDSILSVLDRYPIINAKLEKKLVDACRLHISNLNEMRVSGADFLPTNDNQKQEFSRVIEDLEKSTAEVYENLEIVDFSHFRAATTSYIALAKAVVLSEQSDFFARAIEEIEPHLKACFKMVEARTLMKEAFDEYFRVVDSLK